MKNILWLVSWYPNRLDKTNGNFIQRHAKAASLFANIHVLYLQPVEAGMKEDVEEVLLKDGNLTEQIIYYNASASFLKKLKSLLTYYRLSKKYVRQYIKEKGLPAYVHVHVPLRAGTIALWMKKKFGVNYALTEQYGIYNKFAADRFEKRSFYYRKALLRIIKNAQPLICVSQQLANEMNEVAIKIDYIIIPNVVNTEFFKYGKREQENPVFRFLHVSNMLPIKNVEGIIDAAKLLANKRSDFELRIVGTHPEHIFKHAEQSSLLNKHIFFAGQMQYPQVAKEMQQADTFILFSHNESGSCVLEEALCCGLPVISTPVGNKERVGKDNGILVAINDSQSLADGMNAMINNQSHYNRQAISEKFVKQLSYEVVGKKIVDCYGTMRNS